MTSKTTDPLHSKVGPKDRVVISKRPKKKYAIKPGKEVERIEIEEGVLIKSIPLLEDWTNLSRKIGKKWPKNVSSIESVREDRER